MNKVSAVVLAVLMLLGSFAVYAEDAELMAAVSTPIITYGGVINGIEVIIRCTTSGSKIYYTLDGTTPTDSSLLYTEGSPIVLSTAGEHIIKAIAYKSSSKSSVKTFEYTLKECDFPLEYTDSSGNKVTAVIKSEYKNANPPYALVSINGLDSGDATYHAYYTVGAALRPDVNDPTGATKEYTASGIRFERPSVLRILFCRVGYAPYEKGYNITFPEVWTDPVVSLPEPKVENFYGGKYLSFVSDTEDVDIYYATDSSRITRDITTADTKLSGRAEFTEPVDKLYFKAFAVKEGYYDSDQTSGRQYISIEKCTKKPTVEATTQGTRKLITMTTSETDAKIFYTLDGTAPDRTKREYTGSFLVGQSCTIRAVSSRAGYADSDETSKTVSASGGVILENPSASAATAANGAKTVTLSCATEGAKIYYRIFSAAQGTDYELTQSGATEYTSPIVFDTTGTSYLYYVAYLDGEYSDTKRASVAVTITGPSAPTASAATLTNGIKAVTLSAAEGCKIYYVLGDSSVAAEDIPLDADSLYSYPITVNETKVLSAIAVDSAGLVSDVYKVRVAVTDGPVAPDKVGELTSEETVTATGADITLSCESADADIFYVVDYSKDTVATTAGTPYTAAVSLKAGQYLHAVAAKPGYEYSYLTVTPSPQKTATPVIIAELDGSEYMVAFTSTTPNARFYYTTDGAEPTTSSSQALGGIAYVDAGVTIKAIAVADGYAVSDVAKKVLPDGNLEPCADIESETEDIIGGKRLSLSSDTYGAVIYYTLDGTAPTEDNGLLYDSAEGIEITLEGTSLVRAVAVCGGYNDSAAFSTEITLDKLDAVRAASAIGQDLTDGKIYIAYQLSRATTSPSTTAIYYTLNGTEPVIPTSASEALAPGTQKYTGLIKAKENCSIKAVAAAPGIAASDVRTYEVTMPGQNNDVIPPVTDGDPEYVMGGALFSLSTETEGASIYYSFDKGSEPDRLYTEPVFVGTPGTSVYAIAKKAGLTTSRKMSWSLSKVVTAAEAPEANIENNSVVAEGTELVLTSAEYTPKGDSGAEAENYAIFYTTDGSMPTINSTLYTEPIIITGETVVRAVAAGIGYAASEELMLHIGVAGGEVSPLTIDTDGLSKLVGEVSGSVRVLADTEAIGAADGRVLVALYSGQEMLAAKSAPLADSVTFEDISVLADGSVIVKAFVFADMESIEPLCECSVMVFTE